MREEEHATDDDPERDEERRRPVKRWLSDSTVVILGLLVQVLTVLNGVKDLLQ